VRTNSVRHLKTFRITLVHSTGIAVVALGVEVTARAPVEGVIQTVAGGKNPPVTALSIGTSFRIRKITSLQTFLTVVLGLHRRVHTIRAVKAAGAVVVGETFGHRRNTVLYGLVDARVVGLVAGVEGAEHSVVAIDVADTFNLITASVLRANRHFPAGNANR